MTTAIVSGAFLLIGVLITAFFTFLSKNSETQVQAWVQWREDNKVLRDKLVSLEAKLVTLQETVDQLSEDKHEIMRERDDLRIQLDAALRSQDNLLAQASRRYTESAS